MGTEQDFWWVEIKGGKDLWPVKRDVLGGFFHIFCLLNQREICKLNKQYEDALSCGNPPETGPRTIEGSDPSLKSQRFTGSVNVVRDERKGTRCVYVCVWTLVDVCICSVCYYYVAVVVMMSDTCKRVNKSSTLSGDIGWKHHALLGLKNKSLLRGDWKSIKF